MNPPNDYEIDDPDSEDPDSEDPEPEDPDEPEDPQDSEDPKIVDSGLNPYIRESKPLLLNLGSILVFSFFIVSSIIFYLLSCRDKYNDE